MNQFVAWLYPLIFVAILALVARLRSNFVYSWSGVVQAGVLLIIAILGFVPGPDWLFAIIGWVWFFLFFALPRMIFSRLQRMITLLNARGLVRCGRELSLIYWGKTGAFWRDATRAMALYIQDKPDKGLAILAKWEGAALPNDMKEVISSYRFAGNAIVWNWGPILEEFERVRQERPGKVPQSLNLWASRANAESGNIKEAAALLEQARLPEARLPTPQLALTLLPFFALSGALSKVEEILSMLSTGRQSLPVYSRLYWLGRCQASMGRTDEAKKTLAEADSHLRGASPAWQKRIAAQLKKLEENGAPPQPADFSPETAQVWSIFELSDFLQGVISPRENSITVNCLIWSIVIAYAVTAIATFLTSGVVSPSTPARYPWIEWGWLSASDVLNGQYYRLFSYLFLHASITHCLVNVFALYWFGRIAERMYGTVRFLAIYFVTGVLSGIAFIFLSPLVPAVGASGSVMGIVGAVTAGIFRMKDIMPPSIRKMELSWMIGLILAQILLDQVVPQVAVFIHLGGIVAGIALGLILPAPRTSKRPIGVTLEAGGTPS